MEYSYYLILLALMLFSARFIFKAIAKKAQEESNSTGDQNITPELEEVNEKTAAIYFSQGNPQAATEIYEKLILKHPEKKDYYLSQIEILKS